jgi:glucose-6-phosphate isomerase
MHSTHLRQTLIHTLHAYSHYYVQCNCYYCYCYCATTGRTLRFLANVDPVDVARALEGLDPEETLVVVVSKTFTTAETMLNAKTLKDWLLKNLSKKVSRKAFCTELIN